MDLNQRILFTLISLLPCVLLCIYIYYKDRVEKEPIGLLALLFGVGAVSFAPVYFLRGPIAKLILKIFGNQVTFILGMPYYASKSAGLLYELSCSFFISVLVEEILRWLALYLITSRMKEFDCLFDGIVYSVFLSLGFSAAETVRFAIYNGWDMLLSQTLTAVGHILFGIVMGFFYTLWHVYSLAAIEEKKQIASGKLSGRKVRSSGILLLLSFVTPLLLHTVSSFSSSRNVYFLAPWTQTLYYILLAVIYVICFIAAFTMSKRDNENETVVSAILKKRHPEFSEVKEDGQNG